MAKHLAECTFGQALQSKAVVAPRLARSVQHSGLSPCLPLRQPAGQATDRCSHVASSSYASPTVCAAAVGTDSLADLELQNILNQQGLIQPSIPENTQATVFAIFDEQKKLQYVGFSKDCRNSLRTVFSRRPAKTYYYKAAHLPELNQQAMMGIRDQWFEEVGGAPNGNRLVIERNQWQLPISSGAISERGKRQAAEKEMEMLMTVFATRGCKEDFVPDSELLNEGKITGGLYNLAEEFGRSLFEMQVEFLPSKALTPEELERQRLTLEARSRALRNVVTIVDGNQANFEIMIDATFKTNGGYIFDVRVVYEERETPHRVIIGKEYYEDFDLKPEQTLDRAFAYLLSKKVQRQTEGLMMNGEFPINYFSISTIEQYFDDFSEAYLDTGKLLSGDEKFWRFNRIHDYGEGANKTARQLADARALL